VIGLLTTVTEEYERISMHGVRVELLHAQADAVGLPLTTVRIPPDSSDETYQARMGQTLEQARSAGIFNVGFGDLFLADVREYRETMLGTMSMRGVFPLWKLPTRDLAERFIDDGFRAVLTCVDTHQIPGTFAGREFDRALLDDLPPTADPCGENGEFHTFVYDGPIFRGAVSLAKGDVSLRNDRFMYCDLL
jgi:uncharacterized protein (TIGR00290 family)